MINDGTSSIKSSCNWRISVHVEPLKPSNATSLLHATWTSGISREATWFPAGMPMLKDVDSAMRPLLFYLRRLVGQRKKCVKLDWHQSLLEGPCQPSDDAKNRPVVDHHQAARRVIFSLRPWSAKATCRGCSSPPIFSSVVSKSVVQRLRLRGFNCFSGNLQNFNFILSTIWYPET